MKRAADRTRPTAQIVVMLLLGALAGSAVASAWQEGPAAGAAAAEEPTDDGVRALLDSIREDLVQLRFEKALAACEALLGRPGMSPDERAEALILRSQVHVAFGDLDAAEAGYREILALRPGYRPDLSLTPTKAMQRFERVAAEMIGRIQLVLDPPDATLWVDGQRRVPDPTGTLPVLAGQHVLSAARAGFDPEERTFTVPAGTDVPIEIRLVPNARTVVVRTEPGDVEVWIDGEPVGSTGTGGARVGAGQAAELVIENLPLGEHEFELRKECFRTELLKDSLTVDLLDRSPKVYKTIRMTPARAGLSPVGGPAGSEVWIDGRRAGVLPVESLGTCPGERTVEIRLDRRRLLREVVELGVGEERRIEVDPRPNLVRVGVDAWPSALADFVARFNRLDGPTPDGDPDFQRIEAWQRLDLPLDTDLALAVRPPRRLGEQERWTLYSPLLRVAVALERAPADAERPDWTRRHWGLVTVDSLAGGAARVVAVADGGPAAAAGLRPGARLTRVDGQTVQGSPHLRRMLASAAADSVAIEGVDPAGQPLAATISARPSPFLPPVPEERIAAVIRAAWASVDALATDAPGLAAQANLARILAEFGQHDEAIQRWRRVTWPPGNGIAEGTREYYLGLELERIGDEQGAVAAYRKAAASTATAIDDGGPQVAPAARDRLADLGVAVD